MHTFALPEHRVEIKEDHLYSHTFEDVFHSTSGASKQAMHVFIHGNKLDARFKEKQLSIAELGFGTGINFLSTWITWKKSKTSHPLLYTSIEGYPIKVDELQSYLSQLSQTNQNELGLSQQELDQFISELTDSYPKLIRGVHNISLDNSRVFLNLIFHPVEFALKNIQHQYDAWFIDGFSPQKNEHMWSQDVLGLVFKNTRPGGTFATYSTSRLIKEHATAAGFSIEKKPGFSKRERC